MRTARLSSLSVNIYRAIVAVITARNAADLIGLNRNTAAYHFQKLRQIIVHQLEQESHEVFAGEIEVDESYFGGTRKGYRSRGAAGKVPALRIRTVGAAVMLWVFLALSTIALIIQICLQKAESH